MTFLLAALCCLAQASDSDRNEGALKKFGESRTYRVLHEIQKGTTTLKTRVETVKDKKVVVLEDVFSGTVFDKGYRSSTAETASLDRFRMMTCKAHVKAGDEDVEVSIDVKGTKAVATVAKEGKDFALSCDITDATVSEAAMIRLLCAQEQKEGRSFKVDMLNIEKIALEKDHVFTCLGKEEIEVSGRRYESYKWQEKWKAQPRPREKPEEVMDLHRTYWVSVDGFLLERTGFGAVLELGRWDPRNGGEVRRY